MNLLVRPEAVTTPGPLRVTAVDIRYRGPGWVALAEFGEGEIEVELPERVSPGTTIGVSIDPDSVTTLD